MSAAEATEPKVEETKTEETKPTEVRRPFVACAPMIARLCYKS